MKTKLHELLQLGQSVWLDYIHRSLINSGGLRAYVDKGLRGVTSNPTLFEKAMAKSDVYDDRIHQLAMDGKSAQEVCEELMIEDSRMSADILRPVYDESEGADGYFSLEVNPHLARDTEGSVAAALRLARAVDRPNIMIKIPATAEGLPAIQALIAEGHNINITLMFSIDQYDRVAEAFLSGLERRAAMFHELGSILSVASFFVSRVDTKVDALLDKINTPEATALQGQIGIANARMAYQRFKETFHGERWIHLLKKGARPQRVLYGSTGTKNPKYSDVLYADNLIGPDTVNTMPPETLEAFLDHGKVAPTLERDIDSASRQLSQLDKLGIDLKDVTHQLLDEGVKKFENTFDSMIKAIYEKESRLITA